MDRMKIASFNVNSVRARLPVVLSWLRERRPYVLAMQETKVQDREFPLAAFVEAGYTCVVDVDLKSYLDASPYCTPVHEGWPKSSG